jgi:hypothetical protein
MTPLVADPVTLVVRFEAAELLTGVAVNVDDVIAAGFTPLNVHAMLNWSPD